MILICLLSPVMILLEEDTIGPRHLLRIVLYSSIILLHICSVIPLEISGFCVSLLTTNPLSGFSFLYHLLYKIV